MSEKWYKISESNLLKLIARDIEYSALECAGVDNWDDGGVVHDFFEEDCKNAGLSKPVPECNYSEIYNYQDLARVLYLKDYEEI